MECNSFNQILEMIYKVAALQKKKQKKIAKTG